MAFKPFKILKGLLIKEENTNTPKQIEITPGGTANTKTTILSSQTVDRTLTLPDAADTLMGKATTDVMTNKTFDADGTGNSITNIENADIKAAAGIIYSKLNLSNSIVNADIATGANISATKLGTGVVDNTEFNYLDGVTSSIQTQFTNKLSLTGGTLSGALDLGGNKITSLGTPTATTDAVTKAYADGLITNVANKQLSNLGTTAINQELRYASAFAGVIATADNAGSTTSTITLATGDAGAGLSGSVTIKSGTASVNNNSGDITLQTGSVSGTGVKGKIKLSEASLATASTGYVWTLQNSSTGEGSWSASSGGGSSSLITNGTADNTSSSIFVPYQDSSGTRPSDGNGGTTTGITTSISSTTPLAGTKSFLLTKDAVNRQGGGWAVPFTVDPAYRAKSLKISMDYIVNTGTFIAGTQTADSDVICYIYDVTNSQLIEPSNIKFLASSTSISDKIEATFQTSATGSSYRLIFHIASTSASAYELKVDNVIVSPQTYVFGTPVTDWQSYTPTFTGFGTISLTEAFWRRSGDSIQIRGRFTTGNPTGVTANISLPPGMSVSTTKEISTSIVSGRLVNNSNTGNYDILITGGDTFIKFGNVGSSGLSASLGTSVAGSGEAIGFDSGLIPINGLSSSVQMSDQADTRVVAARAFGQPPTGTVGATLNNVIFGTIEADSHGSYNSTTGIYTVRVPGFYNVSALLWYQGTLATGNAEIVSIYKNNTEISSTQNRSTGAVTTARSIVSSVTSYFNLNDTINIKSYSDATTAAFSNAAVSSFSLHRISGPSAIAATESINMRAVATSGQTFGNATAVTISYPTVTKDTHSAWNGTQFKAPISGTYKVLFRLQTDMVTSTATNYMQLYKNVSTFISEKELPDDYKYSTTYEITDDVYLLAGETVECKHFQATGSTRTAITASGRNTVVISRIGN